MASRNFSGTIEAALKDLLNERAIVDDAIQKLQSLIEGTRPGLSAGKKKRGRPAGSVTIARKAAAASSGENTGAKRQWSAAARRKAAERMRTYWANQRKQKATAGATKKTRRA